jgi:hypothetical protein
MAPAILQIDQEKELKMDTPNFGFYPRRALGLSLLGVVAGMILMIMAGGNFITPVFGNGIAVQTLLFAFCMSFVGAMLGLAEISRRHILRLAIAAAIGGALGWLTSCFFWQWMDATTGSNSQWWLLFLRNWGGLAPIGIFVGAGLGWAIGGPRFSLKMAGYGILAASLGSLISLPLFIVPGLLNPNMKFISDVCQFLILMGLLGWSLGRERPVPLPVTKTASN